MMMTMNDYDDDEDDEVYGIQEALKEINDFDRVYRRQITTDLQQGAGAEIVRIS